MKSSEWKHQQLPLSRGGNMNFKTCLLKYPVQTNNKRIIKYSRSLVYQQIKKKKKTHSIKPNPHFWNTHVKEKNVVRSIDNV